MSYSACETVAAPVAFKWQGMYVRLACEFMANTEMRADYQLLQTTNDGDANVNVNVNGRQCTR